MKTIQVQCRVNKKKMKLSGHSMARLLDVLREHGMTGTKEGCGEGECGACSVLMNGRLVNACLVPLAQVQDADLTTIEGISGAKNLSKLQEAFLEKGGAQCGICTPGMVMASVALLRKKPRPSEADIRAGLAGNLCRCTGFTKIFEAVRKGAR
jgi:carbon-monoxide dehydrogenase small subunit